MKNNVTAIILTKNEELHLARCIKSLKHITSDIVVIDSGSIDKTVEIAKQQGCRVFIKSNWTNHAAHFNWALDNVDINTKWILRIDADEFISGFEDFNFFIESLDDDVNGITIKRFISFKGKIIKWGNSSPVNILRIFRFGKGKSENRWMDEHIIIEGKTVKTNFNIIDADLKSSENWIKKHNIYASKEAIDFLRKKKNYDKYKLNNATRTKRLLKERIFNKLPLGVRPFLYFLYRYFFSLGFLDGVRGFEFHFMQGLWYRYLVDIRIKEIQLKLKEDNCTFEEAVLKVTGIDITE